MKRILLVILLLTNVSHGQQMIYSKTANFENKILKKPVSFKRAHFQKKATFSGTQFDSTADFTGTHFEDAADFFWTQFGDEAYFNSSLFKSGADFSRSEFSKLAYFDRVIFEKPVKFEIAKFRGTALFSKGQFKNKTSFSNATFYSLADFFEATFNKQIDFRGTQFYNNVNFRKAKIDSLIICDAALFSGKVNFTDAKFKKNAWFDFNKATIRDTIYLGTSQTIEPQNFNFIFAKFPEHDSVRIHPDSSKKSYKKLHPKLILQGPLNLKIQVEKFKYLALIDTLDYYAKKNIITALKQNSFSGPENSKARFELDFLFKHSTMYQEASTSYKPYPGFSLKRWWRWFYYKTMRLGYRPFNPVYLVLGIILLFSLGYVFRMSNQIRQYISKEEDEDNMANRPDGQFLWCLDDIIMCVYFSVSIFFSFRLKKDLLLCFDIKEKIVIVSEWILGFFFYVYFLLGSESGSIMHTLKSLFWG